jgi:ABC-2 type transport system permease protein
MKLREIFRFELGYQLRGVQTWLFFAVLGVVAFIAIEANFLAAARNGDYLLNSPFVVAYGTVIGSAFWLLVAAAVAGEAAARDMRTRMHPLTYTAPVRKADYLGGRFLAAFVLNALILLAVPAGIVAAVYFYGEARLLGPFRPAAYLAAYGLIALPNAFVVTAIQFSLAARTGRAVASYLGSMLLFITAFLIAGQSLPMLDPIGVITIAEYLKGWTPIEKNARLMGLEGSLLANRLLWLGIALGTLAFTHFRFRFVHPAASAWWRRSTQYRDAHGDAHAPAPADSGIARSTPISVPQVRRTFGFATRARQTLAIAWTSFGSISKSRGGLLLLALVAMLAALAAAEPLEHLGVPLLPRTDYVLRALTFPEIPPAWIIIPLLIVFWSGELVWREREAALSEIADAAPVPEWVLFLGKLLGLGLVLVACMALRMAAGMLVQRGRGYDEFEVGLYLQVLFGLQLADYLLLALLALVVQVVVNQRHVGHLVTLIAFGLISFASAEGIGHHLLVYGSGPGWSYTNMRGFGTSLGPWLWLKLYWTAWALLLAVVARLLWARGREEGVRVRLQIARCRFTSPTAATAAAAVGLILTLGGFIFYNTNVLSEYATASDRMERRAEYERRYGQYEGIPQPRLTGVNLHVEIDPERRAAEIRGTYRLLNRSTVAIDSVHLATVPDVETGAVAFDRPADLVLADEDLGHRIYTLDTPLQPGGSLRLGFEVRFEPRGFRDGGALPGDASVAANGTFFTNQDWLPAIGYQANRELHDAGMRREHGLAPRPLFRSLDDVEARQGSIGEESIAFEAVVGTGEDQIAVAPGALRRTWTESGRRYFHYSTDAPIGNEYAFLSADYAVQEGQWKDPAGSGQVVAIRIFHQPGKTTNVDRMLRSVRASLDYYTEQFRPYPHHHIYLVERPGHGMGMHADASMITFTEAFSLLNPEGNPRGPDLPFSVVAHEVAHQWWGSYLAHTRVEGAVLLSETLAQYSAYQVVKKTYGQEQLRRLLLSERREEDETPRTRADVPLLRATTDRFHRYRKGPWAMYALSEYVGEERVNRALRRLLAKHRSGALLTSLDLYRELQAVTPGSLQDLLHDLFEANTFWELETRRATAEQTDAGTWRVTLDVRARKVIVDEAGVETEVSMNDWVEVGVFASAEKGETSGKPLYVQKHRVRSGQQTVTVTVPRKPVRAGIDPHHLLIDLEMDDNVEAVKVES